MDTLENKIQKYQRLKSEKDKIELKSEIFEESQNLIWKFINMKLGKNHQDADDVFQDSYIKFEKAIQKFDIKRGFKFSTYLKNWVDGAIYEYHKNKHTIHISHHAWQKNKTLAHNAANKVLRLDKPKEHTDGDSNLHEIIGEPEKDDHQIEKSDLQWFVDNKLKENERIVITFLDLKDPPLSLADLEKITFTVQDKLKVIRKIARHKIQQWMRHGKEYPHMEVRKHRGRPIPPFAEVEKSYNEIIRSKNEDIL